MAQMAATAGSVAIGSTIGHGLSSMLFGGGSNAAAAEQAPPVQQQQQQQSSGLSCEIQAKGMSFNISSFSTSDLAWQISQNVSRKLTFLRAHGISSNLKL